MDDIIQSYADMVAASEHRFQSVKQPLLDALSAEQIVRVEVDYDGEGDSGQIEDIQAYHADGSDADLTSRGLTIGEGDLAESFDSLRECIDIFAWDVIAHYHDGFGDNDGGYGTLTVDVIARTVCLVHKQRFTDVCVTETEV